MGITRSMIIPPNHCLRTCTGMVKFAGVMFVSLLGSCGSEKASSGPSKPSLAAILAGSDKQYQIEILNCRTTIVFPGTVRMPKQAG